MNPEITVVAGATGNIGRKLVEDLLAKGKKVRAMARTELSLMALEKMGAEIFTGSLENADDTARAFQGARAAFILVPPKFNAPNFLDYQHKVTENLARAISGNGVQHVVNLSSVGAHLPEKNGPIRGLRDGEVRLNALKEVHIVHLRPSFFMENLFFAMDVIKTMGVNGSALKSDLAIPMIATRDIAAVAAELLAGRGFSGHSVRELLGQRDLAMNEATAAIGKAIGKPDLKYVQFPYPEVEKALLGMGASKNLAETFVEMYQGFNDGIIQPVEKRSPQNTTPTSIEQFAGVFAAAYQGNREAQGNPAHQ